MLVGVPASAGPGFVDGWTPVGCVVTGGVVVTDAGTLGSGLLGVLGGSSVGADDVAGGGAAGASVAGGVVAVVGGVAVGGVVFGGQAIDALGASIVAACSRPAPAIAQIHRCARRRDMHVLKLILQAPNFPADTPTWWRR